MTSVKIYQLFQNRDSLSSHSCHCLVTKEIAVCMLLLWLLIIAVEVLILTVDSNVILSSAIHNYFE